MEGEHKTEKIDLYEEDLYGAEEVKEDALQLIVFRISTEWYGVEITKVKEVVKVDDITYLPSSPKYIAGIINLRGNILSVMDFKGILNFPQKGLTEKSRLVVVEFGTSMMGLLADEVSKVLEIPISKIDPPLITITHEKAEYIEGECRVDDKLIGILKVGKIFNCRS